MNNTNTTTAASGADALYGPGAFLGWYLTLGAFLVSWTLHPTKRKQDSIDPDFVVFLTLPLVAAVHLISQLSKLPRDKDDYMLGSGTDAVHAAEAIMESMAAPLVVIDTFLGISCAIAFHGFYTLFAKRRLLVVLIVDIICLAADCFFYSSGMPSIERSSLCSTGNDFASLVSSAIQVVIVIGFHAKFLDLLLSLSDALYIFVTMRKQRNREVATETEVELGDQVHQNMLDVGPINQFHPSAQFISKFKEMKTNSISLAGSLQLICVVFGTASTIFFLFDATELRERWLNSTFPNFESCSAPDWITVAFSKSNSSMKDLDQKVAVLGGLTALSFSLYSALSNWYAKYKESRAQEFQHQQDNIGLRQWYSRVR